MTAVPLPVTTLELELDFAFDSGQSTRSTSARFCFRFSALVRLLSFFRNRPYQLPDLDGPSTTAAQLWLPSCTGGSCENPPPPPV